MIGLILVLIPFITSAFISLDVENMNNNNNIFLYYFFCSISGGSLGFYGSTTLIILFNKFNGMFEIIGLSCLIEFITRELVIIN